MFPLAQGNPDFCGINIHANKVFHYIIYLSVEMKKCSFSLVGGYDPLCY